LVAVGVSVAPVREHGPVQREHRLVENHSPCNAMSAPRTVW
jgi:hypothetical protein